LTSSKAVLGAVRRLVSAEHRHNPSPAWRSSRSKILSPSLYGILQLFLLSNSRGIGEEGDIHAGDSEEGVGGEDELYRCRSTCEVHVDPLIVGNPATLHIPHLGLMIWLLFFMLDLAVAFNNPPGVDIWCGKAYRATSVILLDDAEPRG
jgi:hypothetical protein